VAHDAQYDGAKAKDGLAALTLAEQNFETSLTRGQVFGIRKDIVAAAAGLEGNLQPLIERLRSATYNEAAANQAISFLADPGNRIEFRDYHSARQLAWAIREIAKDARLFPYRSTDSGVVTIDQLFHVPGQSKPDVLMLKLPATQQVSIVEQLRETLPAIADYDPARFRQQIQLVPKTLKSIPKYESPP
jgi:hypothetical protein